jgi:glutamyl-tRNA reductase
MLETTENIGDYLKWSSMADNAVIGLEFLLIGEDKDIADELLDEGLHLCDILSEEISPNAEIKASKLETYKAMSTLALERNIKEETTEAIFKDISSKAKNTKGTLLNIRLNKKEYSEADIREIQKFFNEISSPYVHKAFKHLQEIAITSKRVKGKCMN